MARLLERYVGMRVLVVDDNPINVALFTALLQQQGLSRVYIATDSRQVQVMLAEIRPDLVLLDLHMPHLDGFEILDQIWSYAAGEYLPVLVITGDATPDARDRALGQGAHDFLTQPIEMTEAVLRIANLLRTRQMYSTLRSSAGVALGAPAPGAGHERHQIETVLRDRAIQPVYQPVVEVGSLETIGHEALSRFADATDRGPDRWFTDAFAAGLGVELEFLAVTKALPYLLEPGVRTFLSLNMSPATVLHAAKTGLCDPQHYPRVVVELTEHVPVEDYSALGRALADMRAQGVRLAVDDVGVGYAGFRHLVDLTPDIIKLDISIVAGIDQSLVQRALAKALVSFATDIGATLIGEGVETEGELDVLRDLGVPWVQGYYVGRPAVRPGP